MKQPNAYRLGSINFEHFHGKRYRYDEDRYTVVIPEQTLIKMGAAPVPESKQIEKLKPIIKETSHTATPINQHYYKTYNLVDVGDKVNEILDHLQKG